MLEREGPEALSFRAVARELGMTVGALSRYFSSLADLQDAVAAKIIAGIRPLDGKGSLRQQLLRLTMEMLAINQAHPYLVTIHGPASAAVIARHARQSLQVLMAAGIDLDRAMSIYSLLGSLTYAWAAHAAPVRSREKDAEIAQAFLAELGDFSASFEKLLPSDSGSSVFRRWSLIYIDALLAGLPAASTKA